MIWQRDPEGYLVVRASPDGESPWHVARSPLGLTSAARVG
jgi:hypothetical protein